jgi:hypothetical protein
MNFRHAAQGDTIAFGVYPQLAGGTDRTPIEWRVLQNSGDDLFVLSEYILDCRRYHSALVETAWRDCDMRKWLNSEFLRIAFNDAEQSLIKPTICPGNGEHSPPTEDKVFLLSVAEVREFTDPGDGPHRRRTIGTEYAKTTKANGCRLYIYDKGVEEDYIEQNGEKHGCSWWWTRTQAQSGNGKSSRATFVGARSNIKTYGNVDIPYYGVRPAINIRLTQS